MNVCLCKFSQHALIEQERARMRSLNSKFSDTIRELAERKDTYLCCSSELASTRVRLDTHKKEVIWLLLPVLLVCGW